MYHYITGFIFILLYILLMYAIGYATCENKQSNAYMFIRGYLIYSFFVAIGGVIIQIFDLPWIVFYVYMLTLLIVSIVFVFIKIKKRRLELNQKNILLYFKNNYVLYLSALILTILSLTFIENIWLSNHLDDGYYLSKIGSLGSSDSFFMNFATGFQTNLSETGSYVFNTIESEYAFYCQITNIPVTIFTRFFMSMFNYFLLANVITIMGEIINRNSGNHIKEKWVQWVSTIIILLGIGSLFKHIPYFFVVQDSWQFNTAMFYGSSIVRTMGILLMIFPFVESNKIKVKDVFFVISILIVLISKSSIALPFVFVIPISYLLTNWMFSKDKRLTILTITFFSFILIASFFIPNVSAVQERVYEILTLNKKSILLLISLLSIGISFMLKSRVINKINVFMIFVFVLVCINPLNNIFEKLSVYSFVGARFLTTYIYSLIVLGFIYLCIFIFKYVSTRVARNSVVCISLLFVMISGYSSVEENGNPITTFRTMYRNPFLIPNSTVQLTERLNKIKDDSNAELYVIMPDIVVVDGYVHTPAILLRTFVPEVHSISAGRRYGYPETAEFKGIDDNIQLLFSEFLSNPTIESSQLLISELDKYPINCIVTNKKESTEFLEDRGYHLVDKTYDQRSNFSYYIHYRENGL